ncbi:group 1 truncated hemoglobin [Hymenobacter koreensis]|uniref:Group 1 truncated hemoglobin n=1 Tax=Hymenobacter koreensis TaxID=1084523 RepID=A0ABP8J2Q6_9BACT
MKRSLLFVSLLTGTLLLNSCGKQEETPKLYDRLGKTEGIAKIVDGLIANVGAECGTPNSLLFRTHEALLESTKPGSTDPNRLQRLRNHFIDQVGEATGGPLTYKGQSMLSAHTGMAITHAEFAVWRTQLEASLNSNGVSEADKAELYLIIDKMHNDVVGH